MIGELLQYIAEPIGDGLWQVETVRRAPQGGKVLWSGTMEASDIAELDAEINATRERNP